MTSGVPTLVEAMAALRRGETSAVRLLDDALSRLTDDGDRFNAMLALNPTARAEAETADRAFATDPYKCGPLHGMPIVLKDNIDVFGMATTSGCRALAGAMPHRSAAIVDRLRAGGAVIVGKANLSEFSFEIRSRSSLGGDVLNPFAPHATAGGSSGGPAVAVVRGYALAAIGTDTGGSIRVPAAYTGLTGFRPAHGALSMAGIAPLAPSTDTVGAIAANIGDLRVMLKALGLDVAVPDRRAGRVGVMRELFGSDPRLIAVAEAAIARLEAAGVSAINIAPLPTELNPGVGDHIVDAEFADAFDAYLEHNFGSGTAPASLAGLMASSAFLPDHAAVLAARIAAKGGDTNAIVTRHKALTAHLVKLFETQQLDALVFPTSQVIPETLDNPRGGWGPELAARTGWPAASVCAGWTDEGRPVGIEVLAPADSADLVLGLSAVIEVAPRRL